MYEDEFFEKSVFNLTGLEIASEGETHLKNCIKEANALSGFSTPTFWWIESYDDWYNVLFIFRTQPKPHFFHIINVGLEYCVFAIENSIEIREGLDELFNDSIEDSKVINDIISKAVNDFFQNLSAEVKASMKEAEARRNAKKYENWLSEVKEIQEQDPSTLEGVSYESDPVLSKLPKFQQIGRKLARNEQLTAEDVLRLQYLGRDSQLVEKAIQLYRLELELEEQVKRSEAFLKRVEEPWTDGG